MISPCMVNMNHHYSTIILQGGTMIPPCMVNRNHHYSTIILQGGTMIPPCIVNRNHHYSTIILQGGAMISPVRYLVNRNHKEYCSLFEKCVRLEILILMLTMDNSAAVRTVLRYFSCLDSKTCTLVRRKTRIS